jgi:hypothetical protein
MHTSWSTNFNRCNSILSFTSNSPFFFFLQFDDLLFSDCPFLQCAWNYALILICIFFGNKETMTWELFFITVLHVSDARSLIQAKFSYQSKSICEINICSKIQILWQVPITYFINAMNISCGFEKNFRECTSLQNSCGQISAVRDNYVHIFRQEIINLFDLERNLCISYTFCDQHCNYWSKCPQCYTFHWWGLFSKVTHVITNIRGTWS